MRSFNTTIVKLATVSALVVVILSLLVNGQVSTLRAQEGSDTVWVLVDTQVNPNNAPTEFYGGGKTPGYYTDLRYEGKHHLITYSERFCRLSNRHVDHGYEYHDVTFEVTRETPPVVLFSGERVELDEIYGSLTERDEVTSDLRRAIDSVAEMEGVEDLIPEVGLNMVYSRADPVDAGDVAGLTGRVVRAMGKPLACGEIAYGNEGLWNQPRIQIKCRARNVGTKKRSAHPPCIQTQIISSQEHILNSGANTLDCHGCLIRLPLFIWIAIKVFQIKARHDECRGL